MFIVYFLLINLVSCLKCTPFIREIKNIDLNYLKKSDIKQLKNFFKVNPVLVFKDQHLTPERHYEICKLFDNKYTDLVAHPFNETAVPSCPQLAIRGKGFIKELWGVRNKKINNSPSFFYTPLWHQDLVGSLGKNPTVISSMYMLETPLNGGETLFANLEKGYQNLESNYDIRKFKSLKCKYSTILSLEAEIDYTGYGRIDRYWDNLQKKDSDFQSLITSTFVEQPFIIRPDKDSEKKAIMISPNKLYNFRDNNRVYTPDESHRLMREILNKCVFTEDNVEILKYEKNDLVLFNNRKVIHSSTPTYHIKGNRFMSLLFLDTNEKIYV